MQTRQREFYTESYDFTVRPLDDTGVEQGLFSVRVVAAQPVDIEHLIHLADQMARVDPSVYRLSKALALASGGFAEVVTKAAGSRQPRHSDRSIRRYAREDGQCR